MTAAMPPLRVGTRGSPLALIQTRLVIHALRPHRAAEPAIIRTTGDIIALSPPLIVEETHIDQAISTIADVLKTVA